MNEETNARLKAQERMTVSLQKNWPALAVIGTGVFLLLSTALEFHLIDVLWPMFIIGPGVLLLMPAYHSTAVSQSRASFLAVPGAFLTTVGLLLFSMNLANEHFEAWAYSWTLLVASVPAAIMYIKRFEPQHKIHTAGYKLIRTMAYLFIGLAVFFEIIIFENFNPLLPLILIGIGIYMLAKQRRAKLA